MRTYSVIAVAVTAFSLAAGTVGAQGKSHDKGKDKDKDKHAVKGEERVRTSDGVIRDRDGNVVRVRTDGRKVPPGLAKKPGQMPPGQYKKRYGTNEGATVLGDILRGNGYTVVRIVPQTESQWVYYRLRDGAEQRAIVSTGTERLTFSNVPAAVLQAVIARLY